MADFGAAVARLLADDAARRDLGRRARAFAFARFSREAALRDLLGVLRAGRAAPPPGPTTSDDAPARA